MIDENEVAEELEKALNLDVGKGNGTHPVPPGKITLSVQIDQAIEAFNVRIRMLEVIKASL